MHVDRPEADSRAWDDADDEPGIFEVYDEAAEAAAIARAREDVAAGRVIPHEQVVEWLKNWGTPEERPAPPEWLR